MKEANQFHPYHQGLLYQLGIAASLNGKNKEAFSYLKQAILINADYQLEGVDDLASLKKDSDWIQLIALQKKWQQPIIRSKEAFTLKDRQLHAEGIDYDPGEKAFYIGSIHKRKIVKIVSGEVQDFCEPRCEGMTGIFGIKIDRKRNILWACSSPMQEMENYDSLSRSAVFKFELSSGKVIKKYELPIQYKNSVFGDLILDFAGNPFISDSKNNIIWTLSPITDQIEVYYTSPEFWNIQGLTFNQNQDWIFISDYVKGVFKINLSTKELKKIATRQEVSLKGIDGIYFYKGTLIAIQNGVNPLRVTNYYLNERQNEVIDYKIIDNNHPDFNEPTLGVIIDKDFYYIANSQWGGYDSDNKIKPNEMLKDIVILKYRLN